MRKERREEWRMKGDQDKPLNNHWYKRQRALVFGLKGWEFYKKNKVYFIRKIKALRKQECTGKVGQK